MAIAFALVLFSPMGVAGMSDWLPPLYAAFVLVAAVLLGLYLRNHRFHRTAFAVGLLLSAHGTWRCWMYLQELPEWKGVAFYLVGLHWPY